MRILFCGDIVGRAGRKVVCEEIPRLRAALNLDVVIVNGENAAHGMGITGKICQELYAHGVDIITTGNHVWDKEEILSYIKEDPALLRPANMPATMPGKGHLSYTLEDGRRLCVMNLMGNIFMPETDPAFPAGKALVEQHPLGTEYQAVIVDFHGETTSEKTAFANYVDGQATLVVGTHTHTPTSDTRILPQGTGFQTDIGMCGDYDSVIGMEKTEPIRRFTQIPPGRRPFEPANGPATLSGVFVESDDQTGLAKRIHPVIVGPHLINHLPDF